GDNNANYSTDLFQGNAQNFVINSDDLCSTGDSATKTITITYVSKNGITKTETYPADTFFDCEEYTVDLLANQCPSTTYSGDATTSQVKTGNTFYSNTSTILTGTGTQYLSADTNVLTAGYYDTNNLSTIDTDLNSDSILSGVTIFGVTGIIESGSTLHSGQTLCYGDSGVGDPGEPCPKSGFEEQDGDNDGTAKDYTCDTDTCTDNQTGLMWFKDHSPQTAGNCNPMIWADAIDYCEASTTGSYSNWRLPSVIELITLADYNYPSSSYLNSVFTQTGWGSTCEYYWSSTTIPNSTGYAYTLGSANGYINYGEDNKEGAGNFKIGVRCVRSE
ncbi:MAG: DUF1566 domain-containing protein, partial [Candidatus Diapherotrites archaeon]|nr:DUF1566 domain-containing protein [Candidatus Diapherotrites archaeon]